MIFILAELSNGWFLTYLYWITFNLAEFFYWNVAELSILLYMDDFYLTWTLYWMIFISLMDYL